MLPDPSGSGPWEAWPTVTMSRPVGGVCSRALAGIRFSDHPSEWPTFGLVAVILGVVRSRRGDVAAFAAGGNIAAAYWFTSSTSFTNPAIDVGRTLTDTFTGIAPLSVPAFVAAQVVGAAAAIAIAALVFHEREGTELVVPHLDLDPDLAREPEDR